MVSPTQLTVLLTNSYISPMMLSRKRARIMANMKMLTKYHLLTSKSIWKTRAISKPKRGKLKNRLKKIFVRK